MWRQVLKDSNQTASGVPEGPIEELASVCGCGVEGGSRITHL